MAMTVIEERFFRSAISFFTRKEEIDWEARRYEISKDVLAATINENKNIDSATNFAVSVADMLIEKLKK